MEMERLVNVLVKSIRTGNFTFYISSLHALVPWFFAMDHANYARWLPVHIQDMMLLKTNHPQVHQEFINGNFVVQRSQHKFSTMSLNQSHE